MRLEEVRIRHLGPFDDFSVVLAALPGPLVAVVGPNGAGKSTLLELALPGTAYRSTPTRGSLSDLATARDALLEASIHYAGRAFRIRHLVDAVGKKSESLVLDAEGAPVLTDTKVKSFDAWAAKTLPPPEVLFSAMFTPQGAGGFLAARPAERKATLLRILGVERLEAMAEIARERHRGAKAAFELAAARLTDERARSGDVAEAQTALEAAEQAETEAAEVLRAAQAELDEIQERRRESEAARAAAEEQSRTRARLEQELAEALGRRTDAEKRAANNRAVLAETDEIHAAVAEVERIKAERPQVAARIEQAQAEARRLATEQESLLERARAARERGTAAGERLADRDAIQAAERALPELQAAEQRASQALANAEAEIEEFRGLRVAGAEDRIRGLRGGLERVEAEPSQAAETAAETLETDDLAVGFASALPGKLRAAEAALVDARGGLAKASHGLSTARALAARGEGLERAETEQKAAEREARELEEQAKAAHLAAAQKVAQAANTTPLDELDEALAVAQPLAAKAAPLAMARERLADREAEAARAAEDMARLSKEIAALPKVEAPAVPDPRPQRDIVASAERVHRQHHEARIRAAHALEQAQAAADRLTELEADHARAALEGSDWARLAGDLGKDGLQALEIDAAGPELTELVNDLLHACHGPRFTVRVETQRASADGKRLLEGCEVVVVDTVRNREAAGETFSGGERVIISEALSLALSMLACRRAGLEGITLVRDESGAALDPSTSRAWISMLRRAAERVKAHRLLFVAHNPDLWELADSRLEIPWAPDAVAPTSARAAAE